MENLLQNIRACKICASELPLGPLPVVNAHKKSKIIIIGQAPGTVVHKSGVPWDDKSGENLRSWMGINKGIFYNEKQIGLIPMGFCYPGKGKSGDLPPRKECAPEWHPKLWKQLKEVSLIMLIGAYAQAHYLPKDPYKTLTERVKNYTKYTPKYFVLPHPSPRNNIWQAKNPWFSEEVLPALKLSVENALESNS